MVPVYQAEIVRTHLQANLEPTKSRKGSKRDPWPGSIATTMGDHMGYPDSILHPVWSFVLRRRGRQCPPRHLGIPYSLGGTDCASCCSFRRDVLYALQYVPFRVYISLSSLLRYVLNGHLPSERLLVTKVSAKHGSLTLEPLTAPRWLAAQDRWEEAIRVLANLHGKGDIGHPNVLAQYREIEEVLRFEREEAVNTWRALTKPRMLNRVVLGMSIQMWSQIVGINTMVSCISVTSTRGNLLIAANFRCTT